MPRVRSHRRRTNRLRVRSAWLFAAAALASWGAHAADAVAPETATGAPLANDAQPPGDASIPFANDGGIYDWRGDGTRGIWVQAANHKWFYGTFRSTCVGLDTANAVGFVASPSGELDHWSYVLIHGSIPCRFASFTTSEAPPRRD